MADSHSRSPRRLLTGIVSIALLACLLWFSSRPSQPTTIAATLEASGATKWYRGNIHTHSLWSDGDDYPEMIAKWYKDQGYQFLCFTDHNVLATTERWIDVEKNKGGLKAFNKLKQAFPKDWVDERMRNERRQVRLKRFDEVSNKFNEIGKYLLIQGEEITDRFGNLPIHMNVSNIKELIPPMRGESVADTMQNNVNAVEAQRQRTGQSMMIHLNHPNFGYAVTAEDLMGIVGEKFFEVYNGHPGVRNSGDDKHAGTERMWDIILTKRLGEFDLPVMYGLAVDDGHSYHNIPSRSSNPGRGWVMVLAKELESETIVEAMEAGQFYSSSGVELRKVISSDQGLRVEVEPEEGVTYQIDFIGTRTGYDPEGKPVLDAKGQPMRVTMQYSDDIGKVLKTVTGTTADYQFEGDELYVRARVTSSKAHPNPSEVGEKERAWVQPLVGPATKTK
ncbi:CehA/McbA family metallohydrolase domain-containing protein [Thalassoroseus pseudoceratinae]|uniref:hypothetical protein n=1 Tax=Thalassoroseus pseudoceratinae TaxID=2713176 RepID=UPI00141ED392|nr:hypothetical protein [Thalassoroseus pseudoceratinae]